MNAWADEQGVVAWVRAHYHRRAVDTRRQARWVEVTAASLRTGQH